MKYLDKIIKKLPKLSINKKVCLSLSGGLDSTVLLYTLIEKYGRENIIAVSFNYGQRHNIELKMAKKTTEIEGIQHIIIDLDYMKDINNTFSTLIKDNINKPKTAEYNAGNPQVDTYISFRNLQFASITASIAETNNCEYIFQALNAVDEYGYWDTSIEFVEELNNILSLNRNTKVRFVCPFVEYYKEDELILARELSKKYNKDILKYTWSCYNGCNKPNIEECKECGVCNTCVEKITGYVKAGYTKEEINKRFKL